jgi:hypothetical protein
VIALDWIGPSLYRATATTPIPRRAAQAYRPGKREPFRDLWLELPEAGDLVRLYDAPDATRPVAVQTWAGLSCDLAYRGRGLLTSAAAERWHRLGRCPLDYLWRAVAGSAFTPDGLRSCVGAHAGAVRRAILDGFEVSPRVIDSLAEARAVAAPWRPPELRRGGLYPMDAETLATLETAARDSEDAAAPRLWAAFASRVCAR